MNVGWSLLLAALVTASPVLADDEIWGIQEEQENKGSVVASTEEDVVDPISSIDTEPESTGAEMEDDLD